MNTAHKWETDPVQLVPDAGRLAQLERLLRESRTREAALRDEVADLRGKLARVAGFNRAARKAVNALYRMGGAS